MTATLAVIVVTWRARAAAERGLDALMDALHGAPCFHHAKVLVVDSASGDGTPEALSARYPELWVEVLPENLGFAAAVNRGLDLLGHDYEQILLLNPDALISAETLLGLQDQLTKNPHVAAVGPNIVDTAGIAQTTGLRFPSLTIELRKQWSPLFFWAPRVDSELNLGSAVDRPRVGAQASIAVDWISGACMLLRREALDEVGRFDEGFFLYFEETDWCLRAAQLGWKIHHCPQVTIIHEGGASAKDGGEALQSGCISSHFRKSRQRYFSKHKGIPSAYLVEFVHAFRSWCRRLPGLRSLRLKLRRVGGTKV